MARLHDPGYRSFASDNYAGAHPEVVAAIAEANGGHQIAYGDDDYTDHLGVVIRSHFGPDATYFPVFNGTAANVLSLQAVVPRWGGVVCAESAHINTDENGAPERVAGLKLLAVPGSDGKLTPELVDRQAWGWGDPHRAQPSAVSVSQSTELGTVYTPDELRALCAHAHDHGMRVHVDGARLANAAAALGCGLGAITTDVGVDIVSFGGTKNGLVFGEVVVVPSGADLGLEFLRKMDMQLPSKMRFVAAQLIALYGTDLWRSSASHANAMARRLHDAVGAIPGVTISRPTDANAVFAIVPPGVADRIREHVRFYDWDRATGEVRWMCAFDTTESDVDDFASVIAGVLAAR